MLQAEVDYHDGLKKNVHRARGVQADSLQHLFHQSSLRAGSEPVANLESVLYVSTAKELVQSVLLQV